MKYFVTFAAALLLSISAFAQDGKSIYNKYAGHKKVEAVYISSAMFRMMGKLPELEIDDKDVNLAPVVKSLNGMYLIECENRELCAKLKADVEKMVSAGKYELMMEIREEDETVRIYTIGTEEEIRGFVFFVIEDDECTFINFDGCIPRESFEKALSKAR